MNKKIIVAIAFVALACLAIKTADGQRQNPTCCLPPNLCSLNGCVCSLSCARRGRRSLRAESNEIGDPHIQGDLTADGLRYGAALVRSADADADGALNGTEIEIWLQSRGIAVKVDAWRTMDSNGDGKLEPHEIDSVGSQLGV